MKTQQVPNSPYFICYDDDGFFCVSKDKDGKKLFLPLRHKHFSMQ